MPIAPSTPFLPSTGYAYDEQSLLIDAVPSFDDSFDLWPPLSPRVVAEPRELAVSVQHNDQGAEASNHDGIMTGAHTLSHEMPGNSRRRSGEALMSPRPTKRGESKGTAGKVPADAIAKPPTPNRNDFYTRRVKDSDRRASLGLRESLWIDGTADPTLFRSISRESIMSTASSRSAEVSRSIRGRPILERAKPLSPAAGLPPPETPSLKRLSSPAPQQPPPSPHPSSNDLPHRTIPRLSTSSSSRRDSFSEKVTGFFSGLVRRRSPGIVGAVAEDEDADRAGQGTGTAEDEREGVLQGDRGRRYELPIDQASGNGDGRLDGDEAGSETFDRNRPILRPVPVSDKNAPRLRLPPTLTRPAPQHLRTATRALQPKKVVSQNRLPPSNKSSHPTLEPKSHSGLPTNHPSLHLRPKAPKDPVPKPTSVFAARALFRLPAPGKGSTSSSQPITIRTAERAKDLASKRETFERLAQEAEEERVRALSRYSAPPQPVHRLEKTVPVRGNTPGKASRQRAEERARFEQGLRERHEDKRRRDEALQRAREEMERAEDRAEREGRIVRAKGLPEIYTRRG